MSLSLEHETPLTMVRDRPELITDLLSSSLGIRVPDHDRATVEAADLTQCEPAERRADSVIVFRDPGGKGKDGAVLGVVFEVQRSPDSSQVEKERGAKAWAWPDYLASLRSRWMCPVMLLVFCEDNATAAWAARPIETGHPEFVLRPLVIGPKSVPVITAYQDAASPELVTLSAAMHGSDPRVGDRVLAAFADMLADKENIVEDRKDQYVAFVHKFLPKALYGKLREIMTAHAFDYVNPLRQEAMDEGRAEGRAEASASHVLRLLAARGVEVPEAARTKINECVDLSLLDTWFDRALTAETIEDVLD